MCNSRWFRSILCTVYNWLRAFKSLLSNHKVYTHHLATLHNGWLQGHCGIVVLLSEGLVADPEADKCGYGAAGCSVEPVEMCWLMPSLG